MIPHIKWIFGSALLSLFCLTAHPVLAAAITSRWMNRRRLTRYMVNPSLVFLSIAAIYTVVIGTVFIGI